MTSVAELGQSRLRRTLRRAASGLYALITTRQRPVLPIYHKQRSPRWRLAAKTVLLAVLGVIAMFYGLLSAIMPLQIMMLMSVPLAIAALLVIWALPEAGTIPEKSLGGLFYLFFVIMVAWPVYLSIDIPGLPWISLRRALGMLVLFMLLISLSVSKDFRARLWAAVSVQKWFIWFFIAFVPLQLVSAIINRPGIQLGRFLDAQILWTSIFFVSAWYFSSNARVRNWLATLLVLAVGIMAIGFFEYRTQRILWAGHIPSFFHVDEEFLKIVLTPQFRGGYRTVTVFSNPLIYAEFLTFVVPVILHFLVNSRTWRSIILWCAMDMMVLTAALFSGARLALVGFIVSHAFYALLWGIRRWRTIRSGLIGPALTLMYPALLVTAGVLTVSVDAIRMRVLDRGATQNSTRARAEQFDLAVPAIARKPVIGYGPGGSGAAIDWHLPDGRLSVDNYYLTIGADYGVTGLVLFFGMIVMMMWWLARDSVRAAGDRMPLSAAVSVLLAVFLTVRQVFSQPDNNPLLYIFLGLGVALLYDARTGRKITV